MDKRSRLSNRKSGLCNTHRNNNRSTDVALNVQITKSIETLLRSNKNGLCNTKSPLNKNKIAASMNCKKRSKLLEECKQKLMGTGTDDESSLRPSRKKRDIKTSAGPSSNGYSRSANSVNETDCSYRYQHGKEMGDYWISDQSEKMPRLKRKRDTDVGDTLRQVFAAARTSNVRKLLKCQNPHRHKEDPKQPCFCQHCGMVDVLMESQKRLYTDEFCDENDNLSRKRSSVKLSKSRNLHDLRERVKRMETTLREYQEKCVTKDYLKLVVDKLISYIAPKSERTPTKKDTSTQCRSKSSRYKDSATLKTETIKQFRRNDQIVGNVAVVQETDKAKTDEVCWKWGEETIKPGLDLKHKILQLLSDTVAASKSNKTLEETLSEQTLYLYGSENQQTADTNTKTSTNSLKSGGNFRKMLDYMSEKIYADYINNEQQTTTRKRALNDGVFKQNVQNAKMKTEKVAKKSQIPTYTGRNLKQAGGDGKVQVTYVSPKVAETWKDTCVCFKVEEHFRKYTEGYCGGRINAAGE